jgi:hypothetical protein
MSEDKQSAIEAAARAMCQNHHMPADDLVRTPDGQSVPYWTEFEGDARAAILAYLSALGQDEGAVEAVARAICADEYGNPDGFEAITLEGVERQTPRWKYCNRSARAVLRTLATRAQGESS